MHPPPAGIVRPHRLALAGLGCAHARVECGHHLVIEVRIQLRVERLAGLR